MSLNPDSATYCLCDDGQIISLCFNVLIGRKGYLNNRIMVKIKKLMYT